jgi:GNAT superfamily N-acetyltransferase
LDGPRACQEREFEEVISLVNQVFRQGSDQDIRTDYPLVFDRTRLEYIRILKVDGKVVAHVPVAPREVVVGHDTFKVGIISPTATHPDYRRRGYATRCLRDCIRIMQEHECVVSVLWTEEATFPFYQHSGWEAVGSQGWVYRLQARERDLFKARGFDVIRYDPARAQHLDAIMSIHDAEPYRIARAPSDYRALFSLPKTSTYLAVKRQELVAYLMVGEGVNKPGLVEGSGDPEGLEALVRRVLTEHVSGQEVQALAPLTPSGLGRLMQTKVPGSRQPIEAAEGIGYQMMRINNLEKLLRQIGDHLRRKSSGVRGDLCLVCSDTGEAVTLRFRDGDADVEAGLSAEPVVLSLRQLAQLIFGPHPAATPFEAEGMAGEILRQVFPFYFPIWELDHS